MINIRLEGLPYKKLSRHDSFIDHLVCPESKIENEIPVCREKNKAKKVPESDKSDLDPTGWDINSNYDNNQILLKKRATTSHVACKPKIANLESYRAKTSHFNIRKGDSQLPKRPITLSVQRLATSTVQRPSSSSQQRQSTPSQKARLGARCFLSALSGPNLSLDLAVMNLIGKNKEKYVI
jgi:hypothetical protein